MSFNKIIVVGNLGRDPELRYTPQGAAVCSFSMATNEKRRDKAGDMQDVTTWFRITLWNKQAENASKYLTKGSSVYIEGRLRVEEWTDKDGKTRSSLEVNASDMQFIGGSRNDEYSGDSEHRSEHGSENSNDFSNQNDSKASIGGNTDAPSDDDIPF